MRFAPTSALLAVTLAGCIAEQTSEPEGFWGLYVSRDCAMVYDCENERLAAGAGINGHALECYPEGRTQAWMVATYLDAYPTPEECTYHPDAALACLQSEEWVCTPEGGSTAERCDGGASWCVEPDPVCDCVLYCGGELPYHCSHFYETDPRLLR